MDSAPAFDVEVVPSDPTQIDTPAQTQAQEQGQQVDLSGIVDGLVKTNEEIRDVRAELREEINGVAGQLDVLGKSTEDLRNEVRASNEQQQTAGIILVDDAQWSEMQQAWWQARDTFGLAFYVELLILFLIAATLGLHLWSAFSKGWRN